MTLQELAKSRPLTDIERSEKQCVPPNIKLRKDYKIRTFPTVYPQCYEFKSPLAELIKVKPRRIGPTVPNDGMFKRGSGK